MNFRIVSLGRDYKGKIIDFARARNSFIENLSDDEWILFIDDDAEATKMLLDFLARFNPPRNARYYSIRTIQLVNNEYVPLFNPFFWRMLVSNKVRYVGKIHEKILEEPTGIIDLPIIHNHIGGMAYSQKPLFPFWNIRLALKKLKDILVKSHYDRRVV